MSLLEQTKSLLSYHKIGPKKHLGQHFMIHSEIFNYLSTYASLDYNDIVLDVGAGLGFLTSFLSKKCKQVLAVEVDPAIIKILRERHRKTSNVLIIEGNILKVNLPHFDKIISFPPYNISSSLILWLFGKKFHLALLVFQKDFAARLNARVNSRKYGWLTVLTHYYMEIKMLDEIPASMFYPPPRIDSVVVSFQPKLYSQFPIKNPSLFPQFVKCLFTERNKKVGKAVLTFIKQINRSLKEKVEVDSLPFRSQRVRTLTPQNFGELANALFT